MKILTHLTMLVFFLTACAGGDIEKHRQKDLLWRSDNGKLKVLSTTAMIHDLVQRVGGEYVDSMTLIKGDLDPHSYQLVKGDDEKFAFAQLIFFNGLGLEHGPSLQHTLYSSNKGISLGDRITKLDPEIVLYQKGQVDPHIWMDISIWAKAVPIIVEALSAADPVHASAYQKNGDELMKEMLAAHESIRNQLQAIPENKRYLVTSHDAFNYFTRAYLAESDELRPEDWSVRFAAPEGLAPESQLSTTDIQFIIDHVAKYKIRVLFPESNVSRDSIRKIIQAGREKGLDLKMAHESLYGDAMGKEGSDGDSYLKMLKHNANIIAKYLMDTN